MRDLALFERACGKIQTNFSGKAGKESKQAQLRRLGTASCHVRAI